MTQKVLPNFCCTRSGSILVPSDVETRPGSALAGLVKTSSGNAGVLLVRVPHRVSIVKDLCHLLLRFQKTTPHMEKLAQTVQRSQRLAESDRGVCLEETAGQR